MENTKNCLLHRDEIQQRTEMPLKNPFNQCESPIEREYKKALFHRYKSSVENGDFPKLSIPSMREFDRMLVILKYIYSTDVGIQQRNRKFGRH